jgi:hypothetical protein
MNPLIQTIESEVNNQPFEYHEDHTSVHGFLRNREGNRFYIQIGATGIASINVVSEMEIEISIPYSAHYLRKHYWGCQAEYKTENKSVRGTYKIKLRLMPSGVNIESLGAFDIGEVSDPAHDSNVMTIRGLGCIISNLNASLSNYENIESKMFELYIELKNMYKNLTNNTQITTVQYIITAGVVQIIESNNSNVIGQQLI